MASKKSSADKKKNASFIIATVILAVILLSSIVLFAISALLNGKTSEELTKSMYPIKYEYYVESYAKEYSVDVCLVYGVIRTESGFDPQAVSQAGAIGLMQLMPDTFTWLQNYRTNFLPDKLMSSDELYKPQVNIEYGTYLLRYLLDRYDGNTSLAIIAYNAGYGNVDNWLADGTIPRSGVTSADIPFTETANYLDRVTEAMEKYRELYYSDAELFAEESMSSSDTESAAEDMTDETDTQAYSENSDYTEYPENEYPDDAYAYEGDGTGAEYYDYDNYDYNYSEEDYGDW